MKKILILLFALLFLMGCSKEKSDFCENDHIFGEWVIIKEPTEFAEGVKERKCENCIYKEREAVQALLTNGTEGIVYELSSNGKYYIVTDYEGQERNVIVGSYYEGLPVEEIDSYAFFCSSITSVTISEGIKKIKSKAFYDSSLLEKVSLPESIEEVELDAFEYCGRIKYNEYEDCNYLGNKKNEYLMLVSLNDKEKSVAKIHKKTKIIYDSAFSSAENIEEIVIPNGVVYIGNEAFKDCKALKSVTLSDSVVRIGSKAFYSCIELDDVVLSENLVKLGADAFSRCDIEMIQYGNCYYIGSSSNPYKILVKAATIAATSFTIHEDTVSIGEKAFNGCKYIKELIVPANIKYINKGAFYKCDGLEILKIPFVGESIAAERNTDLQYTFDGGDDDRKLPKTLKQIIVTEQTEVPHGAFGGCSYVESIEFEKPIEKIESYAFYGCNSLPSLNLPDSLYYIGERAFTSCDLLKEINIPSKVTELKNNTFSFCDGLESFDIPSNIIKMEDGVFSNCKNLRNVTVSENLAEMGTGVFSNCEKLESVSFGNNKVLNEIKEDTFNICYALKNIEIPSGVVTLKERVFKDCTGLEKVTFGENSKLEKIEPFCFENARLLKEIVLPDQVNYIGESAFERCTGLISINIPYKVSVIPTKCFYFCDKLRNITINGNITTIQENAFYKCINLLSIVLPEGLNNIEENAFYGCSSLEKIIIPHSVEKIADDIFNGCTKLVIYCRATTKPTNWGDAWYKNKSSYKDPEIHWGYTGE